MKIRKAIKQFSHPIRRTQEHRSTGTQDHKACALWTCALVLYLHFALLFAGESGRIRGRIYDADTKEPLIGANVIVEGTDLGAATDALGEYLIINVPVGYQSLLASYLSYETQRATSVLVLLDQTITIDFHLKMVTIPVESIIEVKATRPPIIRTDPSTSRYITKDEFDKIPVTSLSEIVRLSPGVITSPSYGMHLRGGRPDEVMYYIDGVATRDPLYGYQAARPNPEATAEVVVISGGFDAEYGEAMSGIVQVVTKEGSPKTKGRIKYITDEPMPKNVNFGYNWLESSLGGPLSGLRYFLSGELLLADDYNPRKYKLPHHNRSDYKLTGKLTAPLKIGEGLKLTWDGFLSREQWEIYPDDPEDENDLGFKYNLAHYLSRRERVRKTGINLNHNLSKNTYYTARLGYFYNERMLGVRDLVREAEERNFSRRFWEDYIFLAEDSVRARDSVVFDLRNYYTEQRNDNTNNPFGVYNLYYGYGDMRVFVLHWSDVLSFKADLAHNIGKIHELKAGFEAKQNSLHRRYNSLPWHPNPFVDSYDYYPLNIALFLQDKMDFEDLVVRAGLRFDYLDPNAYKRKNPKQVDDTTTVKAREKFKFSPRLGISFPIAERTKVRFSYGHFFQTPAYRYLYDSITQSAFARGNMIIGNPDLRAQQTVAYELGIENQFSSVVVLDFTAYYKDIYDLMGVRFQPAIPIGYFPLVNEEYGSVRGFEIGLQKMLASYWTSRLGYGLSFARGTASYTYEWYYDRYRYGIDPVTGEELQPPKKDYTLDFDERHNLKWEIGTEFPSSFRFIPLQDFRGTLLFNYGSGLPYTKRELRKLNAGRRIGEENSARMPARFWADGRFSKGFKLGNLKASLTCEIRNLFNNLIIEWVYGYTGKPDDDGYITTLSPATWALDPDVNLLDSRKYHPARDHNHDGYIDDNEEYIAYKVAYKDFVDNPFNFGPPRQIRIGIDFEF